MHAKSILQSEHLTYGPYLTCAKSETYKPKLHHLVGLSFGRYLLRHRTGLGRHPLRQDFVTALESRTLQVYVKLA